jgi:hypothetical protein
MRADGTSIPQNADGKVLRRFYPFPGQGHQRRLDIPWLLVNDSPLEELQVFNSRGCKWADHTADGLLDVTCKDNSVIGIP